MVAVEGVYKVIKKRTSEVKLSSKYLPDFVLKYELRLLFNRLWELL